MTFQQLKKATCSTPVLALSHFDQPLVVETDACDTRLGAVLMQLEQTVAFLSKALDDRNRHLSIYEKKSLCLIMVVDQWRSYLQHLEFLIRIDHQSLCFLTGQQIQFDLQRKAMTKLMGLQFKIVYKKGKDNVVADALSQISHVLFVSIVTEI